jgi:hypothetical protein
MIPMATKASGAASLVHGQHLALHLNNELYLASIRSKRNFLSCPATCCAFQRYFCAIAVSCRRVLIIYVKTKTLAMIYIMQDFPVKVGVFPDSNPLQANHLQNCLPNNLQNGSHFQLPVFSLLLSTSVEILQ